MFNLTKAHTDTDEDNIVYIVFFKVTCNTFGV